MLYIELAVECFLLMWCKQSAFVVVLTDSLNMHAGEAECLRPMSHLQLCCATLSHDEVAACNCACCTLPHCHINTNWPSWLRQSCSVRHDISVNLVFGSAWVQVVGEIFSLQPTDLDNRQLSGAVLTLRVPADSGRPWSLSRLLLSPNLAVGSRQRSNCVS